MAPPWAAAASASSSPAPLTASPPLPRLRPAPLPAPPPHDSARARLPRGRSPSQCRRTACAPRVCAAGGEEPRPRRRADGPQHRRSTSMSGRRVVGSAPPPFPRRLPPLRHRPPPFLPQRRLCFSRRRGCEADLGLTIGGEPLGFYNLLCFLCPVLTTRGRDKEERGIRYGTRDCTQRSPCC